MNAYLDLGWVHMFDAGDPGVNVTLTRETGHAVA